MYDRGLLRCQIDDGRVSAGARRDVEPAGDRIQRCQAAAIGLQRVDDRIRVAVDDRDRTGAAVHGIDAAIAGIDRQILHIGAGFQRHHGTGGAADDLHDAEVGERRVRLSVTRVDDYTLGTVSHAHLSAEACGRTDNDPGGNGKAEYRQWGSHDWSGNVLHWSSSERAEPASRRVATESALEHATRRSHRYTPAPVTSSASVSQRRRSHEARRQVADEAGRQQREQHEPQRATEERLGIEREREQQLPELA